MKQLEELVESLYGKDNTKAYRNFKLLESESEKSNEVYRFLDTFAEMMEGTNSYIRSRGLLLIAANAKWDVDNKIDELIDNYLKHITDEKPITARQCIKCLPTITRYKPDLAEIIENALLMANVNQHADSMRPLVEKDIQAALKEVKGI